MHYVVEDLHDLLIERIKGKEFGVQLNDSNNDARILFLVLLSCKSISEGTKASDLFEILQKFIAENNLYWKTYVVFQLKYWKMAVGSWKLV